MNNANKQLQMAQINGTTTELIALDSKCFLFDALSQYKKIEFTKNQIIEEIIKVMMPTDYTKAREMFFDGITHNGQKYKGWFSTVNGLKQEDYATETKMETLFVREDFIPFTEWIEDLISLGTFKTLEGKSICINKDVLSRISLITTGYEKSIAMPNIVILKEAELAWSKEYKTIDKETGKLIDYTSDKPLTLFDGGCIAGTEIFDSINSEYKRDDIEFCIFRMYGTGNKGMAIKMDIEGYLTELHASTGDTDQFKQVDGKFFIVDRWGKLQEVNNNTILLNDTQVKLVKNFNSMDEIKELITKYNNPLLEKMYITKVNKPDSKIKDYKPLNYQLLNALALTPNDIEALAEVDFNDLYDLTHAITKENSEDGKPIFKANVDKIMLYFGYEASESDELSLGVCNKINELLTINPNTVSISYIKKTLFRMIEKSARNLAYGKITAKAEHKYISVDPIAYLNFHCTGSIGDNVLKYGEFHSGNYEQGKVVTISRNPLASFQEVFNITFTKNDMTKKWYPKSREIITFPTESDILNLLSSADEDGDSVLCVDNDIIRNGVVTPDKHFISTLDGKKKEMPYTKEHRFNASFLASGNLIGKYAIIASTINNQSQSFANLAPKYSDLTDEMDEKIREQIKANFIANYEEIAKCLSVTLCAIDTPKTLVDPSVELPEICKYLEKKYNLAPAFLKYKKSAEQVEASEQRYDYTRSTLNCHAKYVEYHIINKINERKKSYSKYTKPLTEIFKDITVDVDTTELEKVVLKLAKTHQSERDKLMKEEDKKKRNIALTKNDEVFKNTMDELINAHGVDLIRHIISESNRVSMSEHFIINCCWSVFSGIEKTVYFTESVDGEILYRHRKYTKVVTNELNTRRIEMAQKKEDIINGTLIELRASKKNITPSLLKMGTHSSSDFILFPDSIEKYKKATGCELPEQIEVIEITKETEKSFGFMVKIGA